MTDRKARILERIEADHAASLAILNDLTELEWDKPVPSDEGFDWKGRDVLAHLAVSEGGQLGQLTRCVAGEMTVPDDFDLARFNRRSVQKQADKPVPALLADIERGHAEVLKTLQAVSEADLDKSGRHARGDVITVEQFFVRITEHRREHAEQLQRAVRP